MEDDQETDLGNALGGEEPGCSTDGTALCKGYHQQRQRPSLTRVNVQSVRKICKREAGLNLHYYSSFYRKVDADAIFQQLETQLQAYFTSSPQSIKLSGSDRVLPLPRRQAAFGDRGLSYTYSGITLQANPWTPLVSSVKDHVETALGEKFNFVLVNRYKDGLDYISEHRDYEQELVPTAPIASLSFGQARDFVFRHKDARGSRKKAELGRGRGRGRGSSLTTHLEPVKIELGHGSLLVMCHPTNSMWYHSLPVRRRALHPRINLTFRRMAVPASTHTH